MTTRLKYISITLIVFTSISILILSLLPEPPDPLKGVRFADKIGHLAAYCVLGFLLKFILPNGFKFFLLSLCICSFYGGGIEFLQSFTGRSPEIWDLAADLTGAVIGAAAAAAVVNRYINLKKVKKQ